MLTWLDVLAIFSAAAATAVGAKKGASFLLVFPLALATFALAAPFVPPWAWPLVAAGAGLVWAQLVGRFYFYLSEFWDTLLGGLGGLAWGALVAVALWTGLPATYSLATGAWRYPSPELPIAVQEAVINSPFARPLFERVRGIAFLEKLFLQARPEREKAELSR